MKKIILSVLFLSTIVSAQIKKYTIEDAVLGLRRNLAIKNIYQFSWDKSGENYLQSVKNAYLITNAKNLKSDTLISLNQLNQANVQKLNQLPYLQFLASDKAYFQDGQNYYLVEKNNEAWKIKPWKHLPEQAENVELLADNETFVYTIKNNLYYQKENEPIQMTNETNQNILNGQAVHRNEFGIKTGIFPSPNQQKIAFYRMDQTMVEDYPIINWDGEIAKNENIKYPMAGRKSHEVSIGVYDIKTRKTIFLQIEGAKDQYLTAVTWSPDNQSIFVGVLNRDQNHLKLNQYSVDGHFIKTLFEEKNDKYVEPQEPLLFLPGSTKDFIWQSQRTGFNHLFLYHVDKGLQKQLTSGDWLVTKVLGFNKGKNEVVIETTKDSPLENQIYKVNLRNNQLTKLSKNHGQHYGIMNDSGTLLADFYSNGETPRNVELIDVNKDKSQLILSAENPLKEYQNPEVKPVTIKADDGTLLYGKLILPTDFNPEKKYPVIVYLYNGPHAQLITDSFPKSGNLWYDYLAQRGYIVFSMDGRGSMNRGMKFESATFRKLGTVEMDDQLKGVDYLKSLPYVDADRIGVHGWSFGGFMTTSLMLRHPGVFKVGVAGGPVMDWSKYEIMYTERYMDTPQQNPEGYAQANLLDKVQNLKGKLLLIHGTQDDVVVWQHSINFLKFAVDKNVQLDYFVYPGHKHNVLGKDRVHLMQKITDYFDLYLKDKK